ncbi:hypothetical protein CRG98_002443 [Punica granatum]|uniref:Uncharacterized protein n=1 Tax=Punica granatum TaxID=22663 RepID=A0A2I0L902_PUNGR|nr:hypothetical protein CRG98_002443 [Punica granatum]
MEKEGLSPTHRGPPLSPQTRREREETPPRLPSLIPGGGGPIAGHHTSDEAAWVPRPRRRIEGGGDPEKFTAVVVPSPATTAPARSRDPGDLVGGVVADDGATTARNQRRLVVPSPVLSLSLSLGLGEEGWTDLQARKKFEGTDAINEKRPLS